MLSRHSEKRTAQRGVDLRFIETIFAHADSEYPIGNNCRLMRVSRTRARDLNLDDRLGRYAIIWSDDTARIVTVLPVHAGAAGRRYRHV
jgi:hypothetical protein